VQQSERAGNNAADIVEHECSRGFASIEHVSTGEANIQRHPLIEHVSAGKAINNTRFASAVDELTDNIHSLSVASTEQVLTVDVDVTLVGVPIPMDILFERDGWIADTEEQGLLIIK
jgi:hypothetical protein